MPSPIILLWNVDAWEYNQKTRGFAVTLNMADAFPLMQGTAVVSPDGDVAESLSLVGRENSYLIRTGFYRRNVNTRKQHWDLGDTGNFEEIQGVLGETGSWLFQNDNTFQRDATPEWLTGTITSVLPYESIQPLVWCFYWYEPPEGSNKSARDYTMTIEWGAIYRLVIRGDKTWVMTDVTGGTNYAGGVFDGIPGTDLYRKKFHVYIQPVYWDATRTDWAILSSGGDVTIARFAPRVTSLNRVSLHWSGAFLFSLKKPWFTPYGRADGGTYDAGGDVGSLQGQVWASWWTDDGQQVTNVGDGTRVVPRVELWGGTDRTQVVYGAQLYNDPGVTITPITAGTYNVRSVRIERSENGAARATVKLMDPEGIVQSAMWGQYNVIAEIYWGAKRVFRGISGVAERTKGLADTLTLELQEELGYRIQHARIMYPAAYDGWQHTDVVTDLLRRAGIMHVSCAQGLDVVLPERKAGNDFLSRPEPAATVASWLRYLTDTLTDWIIYQDADGTVHYEPRAEMASGVVETLYTTRQEANAAGGTIAQAWAIRGEPRERQDDTQFLNYVMVEGANDGGTVLTAVAVDYDSLFNKDSPKYMRGEARDAYYQNKSLDTEAAVQNTCRIIFDKYNRIEHVLEWKQDVNPFLDINKVVRYNDCYYRIRSLALVVDENGDAWQDCSAVQI